MGDSGEMMDNIYLIKKIEALQAQIDTITGKCVGSLPFLVAIVLHQVLWVAADLNPSRVRC
jgi:hypothetical protein